MDCDRPSNECGSWDEDWSRPPSSTWLGEVFLAAVSKRERRERALFLFMECGR